MAKTPEEKRIAHARAQRAYRNSAKGKALKQAWQDSIKGRQSKRLRNQTYRDRLKADAIHQLALEQQQERDRAKGVTILPDGTIQAL